METLPSISFTEVIILIVFFVSSMAVVLFSLIFFLRKRQSKVVRFEAVHITELIKLIISVASFVTVCVTLVFLVLQNRIIVAQTRYALQSVESNVFSTVTTQNLSSMISLSRTRSCGLTSTRGRTCATMIPSLTG